jgi:hypothetical protein
VSYHILPNVPVIDAWWSTPFLLPETVLSTLLGPTATIIVDAKGALNGKAMTQEDYPTCKVQLLPFSTWHVTVLTLSRLPLRLVLKFE